MSAPTWLAACPGCGLVTTHRVQLGEAVCHCGQRFAGSVIVQAEANRRRRDGLEGVASAEQTADMPQGLEGEGGGRCAGGGAARAANDAGESSPPTIPTASIRLQDGRLSA